MKDRHELIEHFAKLGFLVGVEVGVLEGSFSRFMCQTIPGVRLYSVDSWGIGDKREKMRNYHVKMYERAKMKLAGYNAIMIRECSAIAVKVFEDNSLDFVYIDANHNFLNVLEDVTIWTDKIRLGGIVSGHDYNRLSVKEAVDTYTKKNGYRLEVTGLDDRGRQSWWFVKKNNNGK